MNPRARFDRACDTVKLSPGRRQKLWDDATSLGLDLDDPTTVVLVVNGAVERTFSAYKGLVEQIPALAQAGMTVAIEAERSLIRDVIKEVSEATSLGALGKFSAQLSETMRRRSRRGLAISVFAVLLAWGSAFLAGRYGFLAEMSHGQRFWDSIQASPSGGFWRNIIESNPTAAAQVGYGCPVGGLPTEVIDGRLTCALRLWLQPGSDVSPETGIDDLAIGFAFWLHSFQPIALTAAGFAAGLIASAIGLAARRWMSR